MKKQRMTTFLCSMLLANTALAAPAPCETFANSVTKQLVGIFHDTKQSEVQKRQTLSTLFEQSVDIDWIGKFVLGRFWKGATPDEQSQYLKQYHTYLTQTYISKFNDEDGMSVDDITLASLTPQSADEFSAKTLIKRKNEEDVRVDYVLALSKGKCRVHDIQVEGVSLITSQRSEFGSLAGSSGVKGVIDAMHSKVTAE